MSRGGSIVPNEAKDSKKSIPFSIGRLGDPGEGFRTVFALFALYVIWGSTYLAIRIVVKHITPYLSAGVRFLCAGAILFLFARSRGNPAPTTRQWLGSAIVGSLLLLFGNGSVSQAEKHVASGLAATMIATVPLWAALFSGLWGRWPSTQEWMGLFIGFFGVALLTLEGNLRTNPVSTIILVFAAAAWAFGSVWSTRLPLPSGMMASAAEMLTGGLALMIASLIVREKIPTSIDGGSLLALVYLVVFGSLVAFSSYAYLLAHVRPALATSYAYVNPAVAVGLGIALLGEHVTGREIVALLIILTGVAMVVTGRERKIQGSP